MDYVSKAITFLGFLAVLHGGYSMYEFSHYLKQMTVAGGVVPADIVIETLVGTALVSIGLVFGVGSLKEISFSRYTKECELDDKNPFAFLETRPGFIDISALRSQHK
ncbi:magnesium transporter [Dipodascopsis tothii]|uniref:magnesium transporter n=1 Tax=Dipodascopsis tothii TaxID=44089 RepID=UPI0034CF91AE